MYPLLSEGFKKRCFVYRYGRHLCVLRMMEIGMLRSYGMLDQELSGRGLGK